MVRKQRVTYLEGEKAVKEFVKALKELPLERQKEIATKFKDAEEFNKLPLDIKKRILQIKEIEKEIEGLREKRILNNKINKWAWWIGIISLMLVLFVQELFIIFFIICFFIVNITYFRGLWLRREIKEWLEELEER